MRCEDWIVLVEPREWAIVGASARAMRNFGLRSLVLVGASLPTSDDEAFRWASGADSVLREARRFDSLESVVHVTDRVVAILREPHRGDEGIVDRPIPVDPRKGGTTALVFEPDHRELSDSELALCARRIALPGTGMSVPQRVAIQCWERSSVQAAGDAPPPAGADAIERIENGVVAVLDRVTSARPAARWREFPDGARPVHRDEAVDLLRSLLDRANPTAREATMILGVLRQMRWALGQRPGETTC